ncbi:cytochrome c [Ramlibacter monticola]|uniref:Cytochrome c n=1 Tax=Ramlibacter monticola TaxID=1926872 RepID=A0A937CVL9_9BURK|nr:cytochrome c [Ramlibacter monticola]MBL0393888.1 cytochrome c [Ramlibacter monticola]
MRPAALLLSGALLAAGGAAAAGDEARARLQYLQHCSGCHLVDGSGSPTKGIPSMRGMLGRFLQVPGGREFIVQVPGVMNSALRDADVANLMNWLVPAVSAATLPAGFQPYTAQEIARLRSSRPADIMAFRARLVREMKDPGTP